MKNVPGDVLALTLENLAQVAVVTGTFPTDPTTPAKGYHLPRFETLDPVQVPVPRKAGAFHLRTLPITPLHVSMPPGVAQGPSTKTMAAR
jgi:hypothetical protein